MSSHHVLQIAAAQGEQRVKANSHFVFEIMKKLLEIRDDEEITEQIVGTG